MFKEHLKKLSGNPKFISGVHNYCDRWCERCRLTSRCMNYALSNAQFDDPESRDIKNAKFWERLEEMFKVTLEMIKEDAIKWGIDLESPDLKEIAKEETLRKERTENHECCDAAKKYGEMVDSWFESTKELFKEKENELNKGLQLEFLNSDPSKQATIIEDVVDIVRWYQHQIFIKLMRAIDEIIENTTDLLDEYPKDSDGSAKVSLIGIDRSILAWVEIRKHFPAEEDNILNILVHLDRLRKKTEKTFPCARSFKRPGFDD